MPDYDFYHGLYSGQQVDSAVARALAGGQLDQDIAAIRAAVGSPLVANTAAEMTNINKIYVYTGSEAGYSTGHWYYYEGGSWQDGGLYNSAAADSAMSDSSTNAVQNKVIKEYVDTAIYAEQTRAEGVESLKAPLASPALTGTPTAPTAAAGTANTQIATTAYADNAVAVEKARAEAVEATKADQSFAEYILLREEEDRQILFGSVVEAAEDSYDELRSSPIHNAITIGQSVYPRMDRTRMAIDAIKGRTVAFNQLAETPTTQTLNGVTFTNNGDGTVTVNGTATAQTSVIVCHLSIPVGHKIFMRGCPTGGDATTYCLIDNYQSANQPDIGGGCIYNVTGTHINISIRIVNGYTANNLVFIPQIIDLTAMYGTTLADSIYAMEQATTGAGVAYVRQRMDLDYYAANAGELVAPVVSGVGFVGFNQWDEVWESGTINATTGANEASSSFRRSKNYIPVLPDTDFYFKGRESSSTDYRVFSYDAEKHFLGAGDYTAFNKIIHIGVNVHFIRFIGVAGNSAWRNVCINLSNPSRNGEYEPYQHTLLSIPSTRLDGVGTAQDILYVREDGENDYALIKRKPTDEVDMGSLNWVVGGASNQLFVASASGMSAKIEGGAICTTFVNAPNVSANDLTTGQMKIGTDAFYVYNGGAWADAAAFKTAMSGKMLIFEKTTYTETVIAEHLTLAEVSAIAENGGIISIVSETGHIVQPDCVMDTVISRSAS